VSFTTANGKKSNTPQGKDEKFASKSFGKIRGALETARFSQVKNKET